MQVIRRSLARGYRVLNDGRVVGLSGKYLRPKINKTSATYNLQISVRDPVLGHRQVKVHQLAAYQWFGDAVFKPGIEVRHLDGDGCNNARRNLALGTAYQNQMDLSAEARRARSVNATFVTRKLSMSAVRSLRKEKANGAKQKDLAFKYGISESSVSGIIRGHLYPDTGVVVQPYKRLRTKHGRIRMYVRGCRCNRCLDSRHAYVRKNRLRRKGL